MLVSVITFHLFTDDNTSEKYVLIRESIHIMFQFPAILLDFDSRVLHMNLKICYHLLKNIRNQNEFILFSAKRSTLQSCQFSLNYFINHHSNKQMKIIFNQTR